MKVGHLDVVVKALYFLFLFLYPRMFDPSRLLNIKLVNLSRISHFAKFQVMNVITGSVKFLFKIDFTLCSSVFNEGDIEQFQALVAPL